MTALEERTIDVLAYRHSRRLKMATRIAEHGGVLAIEVSREDARIAAAILDEVRR